MNILKDEKTKILLYVLVTFFISNILVIFKNPYYGHDIGFHLSRIQSIADCLNNKIFPALIYPNYLNGYGYGNGLFYPDLFLYIPALLVYFGIDCKIAYQLFLFLINIFTFFSMYFCINKITNNKNTSLITAGIYLISSYRLTDLYVRSALGETLCFIFVPLVLLGLYEIFYNDEKKGYYLTIGLFGVLSSHIITLLFCVIVVFVFALVNIKTLLKNKNKFKYLFIYCLLAIGLGSYFIFPFIEAYLADTYLVSTNPATGGWDYTIPFYYVVLEIASNVGRYYPVGIGIIFVILFILFIYFKQYKDSDKYINHYLLIGLLFLLMTTNIFPWKIFSSLASLIQFPWRFMILATTSLLFGFSKTISKTLETHSNKFILRLIVVAFFTFACFFRDMYMKEEFRLYEDEIHYSLGGYEYLPSDVDLDYILNESNDIKANHDIKIIYNKVGTNINIEYSNNNYNDTYLDIPLIYYKGYIGKENNKIIPIHKIEKGIIQIPLHEASGNISIYYSLTLFRIIGIIVSLISTIIFIIFKKR